MRDWIKLSEDGGKVKWRKPILRVGEFEKTEEGTRFEFLQEHIDYLGDAFSKRIPVPLEHTTDPEKNRGWCEGMEVEGEVLFGVFEFSDLVEDPNIFDTSVYIPIVEGRIQAIGHVALTSYPVVDGLGKFESIACSLVPIVKEEASVAVNWAELKAALDLSEDLTDENAVGILTEHCKSLVKLSQAPTIDIKDIKAKHGKLLKLAEAGRKGQIMALPLSKKAQDSLVAIYCTDSYLALSLDETQDDSFEAVMAAIGEHSHLDLEEQSTIQLSDRQKDDKESFLIRDAKRRKEEAKGN